MLLLVHIKVVVSLLLLVIIFLLNGCLNINDTVISENSKENYVSGYDNTGILKIFSILDKSRTFDEFTRVHIKIHKDLVLAENYIFYSKRKKYLEEWEKYINTIILLEKLKDIANQTGSSKLEKKSKTAAKKVPEALKQALSVLGYNPAINEYGIDEYHIIISKELEEIEKRLKMLESEKAIRAIDIKQASSKTASELIYNQSISNGVALPWPPPKFSTRGIIPLKLFLNSESITYWKDVAAKISHALDKTGYFDRGFLYIPNGFAVITKMERFNETGSVIGSATRWVLTPIVHNNSLWSSFKSIFVTKPEFFRSLVFLFTKDSIGGNTALIADRILLDSSVKSAYTSLEKAYSEIEFTQDYKCIVLVYQFQRQSRDHKLEFIDESHLPAIKHLEEIGILKALETS